MLPFLVLYGTTDGQTRKIALFIADTLRANGAEADLAEAGHTDLRPEDYSAVIVATSVHAGGYQRAVRAWVHSHATRLNEMPAAFVSVCLGVLQPEPAVKQELANIREHFLNGAGWRPLVTKVVAGAVPYTRYNWIKRWVMKRIVKKAGGGTDTTRDYEYTDWVDLGAFVKDFAALVATRTCARTVNIA